MKRLIVCCDGTWNRPDRSNATNVIRMTRLISPTAPDGTVQTVFYDQGIGTGNIVDRLTGGAFGTGLDENIQDGYRFLSHNYDDGDEIFVFGFSRGAYTARSLAGLIRKCGLMLKRHSDRVAEGYALYRKRDASADEPESVNFRASYSREVDIKFVGVWDTVGALGVPLRRLKWLTRDRYKFHDTQLSGSVKFAYHALAIDERRGSFEPTLWTGVPKPGQIVEQQWFAGVHSDVGGGYRERGLANITLDWMMRKARSCGLEFDEEFAAEDVKPDPHDAIHETFTSFYRLARPFQRPIAAAHDSAESVHPSALQRMEDADLGYRPLNVAAYLARPGRAGTTNGP